MNHHVSTATEPFRAFESRRAWYLPIKSLCDFVVGLGLLILLAPVIVFAALLVKLTSKGPAFYLQTRVGKDGRSFRIIKLRSMRQDAESGTGAVWCKEKDDRITPIGNLLRATHIDEFPQLINVIKGDMSLVGPRPERPEFVHKFDLQIEGYSVRTMVRPGITGIAQLRLPPDTDLSSVCNKLEFDQYYVRNIGPWLDFITLVCTCWHFVRSLVESVVPNRLRLPTQSQVRTELKRLRVAPPAAEPKDRPEPARPLHAERALAESAPVS